ncbi:MAG: C25 family cysteine peptidase [Bacteroidales bacterium]|nr:C25 family cysteine peptidase [Bacteroidales bacterium]
MSSKSKVFFAKVSVLFLAFICFIFATAQAQDLNFVLLSSSDHEAVVRVEFPAYQTHAVNVNGQTMYKLCMDNAYPMLKAGAPELLQSSTSLIIPEGSVLSAEVLNSEYTLVQNFELAPSKGRLLRNVNPDDVAYMKGAEFFTDQFLYNDTVTFGDPYQLRDFHGVAVHFFPFAYNPVQKELKAYSSITVRIRFESDQNIKRVNTVVKNYDLIYTDHFLNYNAVKSNPLMENGRILILAPAEFCEAMQPYADWKIKNGFPTEIVSLATAGSTSSAIKNYISSYYTNHSDFAFLVMVGDNNKFPTISAGGNISDNYYGEIAGNDVYPDVIMGKISAETVDHVTVQVNKFISYESNPVEVNHFPVYVGIGSSQGPGDDNEYDYQHIRNICNKLTNYTYTSGYELFEGSQGGLDASGNPSAANVTTAVNAGTGIMVYCGHGSETSWVTTGFSVSNVNSLNNANKLPFIISVACVNGAYSGRTCFAEAWLRATKNNQPTGAVGTLMSTINQPWNSPMCAEDHMIEILTGTSAVAQKYTFGGVTFNGMIKMLDEYNDYEVTRTWILFGDPALMVRTAIPQALPLTYDQQLPIGTQSVNFTSTVNGAKVTLTCHNEIVATGVIANGALSLDVPLTLLPTDTLNVLAVAQNYLPAEGFIQLVPVNGPYLISKSLVLHDNGNQNGLADYAETITVDMNLENVGNDDSGNIQLQVRTDDPYLTINNGTAQINAINSHDLYTKVDAFTFTVAPNVPAFHNATVELNLFYNDENHSISTIIPLHAPILSIGEVKVDDSTLGNQNGRLDFNESAYLKFDLHNIGNGVAKEGKVYVQSADNKLVLYRLPYETPVINVDGAGDVQVRVRVDETVLAPTVAKLNVTYVVDGYRETKDLFVKIGFQAEDWESGDFSNYSWSNNSSKPWTITTQNPYEGNYAARSGAISNNGSSVLSISQYVVSADTISFYYKVSSEDGYDMFNFYIDNTLKGSWSGEEGWARAAYAVMPGQHTFKWEYEKDYMVNSGQDMAMIDYIELPCSTTGTSVENYTIENVTVFPNPTTSMVQVMLPEMEAAEDAVCQLYDFAGRLLQTVTVTDSMTTLNLSDYAAGIYVLKVMQNGVQSKAIKIVKEN